MATTPTARAKQFCQEQGWTVGICERWVVKPAKAYMGKRVYELVVKNDLFELFDLVAYTDTETIGIQATSSSNHANRRRKMQGEVVGPKDTQEAADRRRAALTSWCAPAHRTAEVWSWYKSKKSKKWEMRREEVTP